MLLEQIKLLRRENEKLTLFYIEKNIYIAKHIIFLQENLKKSIQKFIMLCFLVIKIILNFNNTHRGYRI